MLRSKAAWKLMHSTTRTAVQDHISFLHCISKMFYTTSIGWGRADGLSSESHWKWWCKGISVWWKLHQHCQSLSLWQSKGEKRKRTEVENKVILMWTVENDRSMVGKIKKDCRLLEEQYGISPWVNKKKMIEKNIYLGKVW